NNRNGGLMAAGISGIHHVTCITGDVQKCVDFYVSVLGLRFIKKSINQDLPDTYHIYFGDYLGTPGTAMTFFGWPTWPDRRTGTGQVTTVSFAVPHASLDFWAARLKKVGVEHTKVRRFDVVDSPEGPAGEESIGTVHHVAWRTQDAASQVSWRELLLRAGRNVTAVIDRWYFRSIYYREPGGVLFEIATDGPGFTVDESPE